ncbi:MAG: hypothetical protein Ct9H300mP28_24320 [Pseudomonadota bacterium]|nr:MAG: hypothetical protein Ct9H300mP28_24320 [Pseudomonadota bacterium]
MTAKKQTGESGHRRYSKLVTEQMHVLPAGACFMVLDSKKAIFRNLKLASLYMGNSNSMQYAHKDLAEHAARGVRKAKGAFDFWDNYCFRRYFMGTEGMKYSLVSREVIADLIETVVGCQSYDGIVTNLGVVIKICPDA